MSIQIICAECGTKLEIRESGGDIQELIHVRVAPCQVCLDSAAMNAYEDDEEDQEAISHDSRLFHPDGSPKSVEEACEAGKGD